MFELVIGIKMIFQGALAAPRYHADFRHARLAGLFNSKLNQRSIDDG